ncbi:MAG: hypothetical protein AAFV43_11710 [Planctomycetota bacterium]
MRRSLYAVVLACVSLGSPGCKTVWPIRAGGATSVGMAVAATPEAPRETPPDGPTGPLETLTEQQALRQVLPKLQRIAQEDPTTHARLLEQLAAAEPSLWPDTVERAESTLRYRQQLAQKSVGRSDVRVASNESPLSVRLPQPAAAPLPPAATLAPDARSPLTPAPSAYPITQPATPPSDQSSMLIQPEGEAEHDHAVRQASAIHEPSPQLIRNQHYDETPQPPQNVIRTASLATADRFRPAEGDRAPAGHAPWLGSVNDAITALSQQSVNPPRSTGEAHELIRLRLLQLAAGDRSAAVAATPGLSSTEQAFWSKQMYAMSVMLDAGATPDRHQRAAQAAPHQAEALAMVRELGPLQVRNLAFCEQVYGYGAYEPIKRPAFEPGEHVTLYAEVDNYRSQSTEDGHHTLLATSYQVVDKHGGVVDSDEFPRVEDYCLTRRRDFHITYGVNLPTAIYAGDYDLEITITDELGDKIGTETLEFTIAAE